MKVTQHVSEFGRHILEGPIDDVIDKPIKIRDAHIPDNTVALIDLDAYNDYGCTVISATLEYQRDATESELKEQQRTKKAREDRERREYERLRARFGV